MIVQHTKKQRPEEALRIQGHELRMEGWIAARAKMPADNHEIETILMEQQTRVKTPSRNPEMRDD